MRNLFLKIFVWFCLAFLMIAATLFVGTLITGMNETLRKEILNRIALYLPLEAKLAADTYETDGAEALRTHIHRMNQNGDVDAYILDASGKDVLGRSPSAEALEVARATSVEEPFVGRVGNRGSFAAQQTVATSGHKYTILLVIPAPSMVKMAGRLGFSRLFGLLTIILVGGGFCFLLARHISNPVVQLSTAAEPIMQIKMMTTNVVRLVGCVGRAAWNTLRIEAVAVEERTEAAIEPGHIEPHALCS